MTIAQSAFIKSFYRLVLIHEKGHKNILSRLSDKFGHDEVHKVIPIFGEESYDEAAERLTRRLFATSKLNLIRNDTVIEEVGYDEVTLNGSKQSRLGGKDLPSVDRLCLPITSTFDVDDEEWTATGDAEDAVPDHHLIGGNPGGFVEIVDEAINGVWYWVAPQKYLGDRSGAYGTLLTFDLKQSALDRPFDNVDVRIAGVGGTLEKRFGSPPGLDWTHYSVALDTTGGWVVDGTKLPATERQIERTLGSLSLLQIRGEYRTGADIGGLDNVVLGAPKGP